jgi:hypothetical protein
MLIYSEKVKTKYLIHGKCRHVQLHLKDYNKEFLKMACTFYVKLTVTRTGGTRDEMTGSSLDDWIY